MTSTSGSNGQHPPTTSAPDFSTNHTAAASNVDSNSHMAAGGYAPNENQLAGLVEAATAAAGQDVSEWAAAAAVAAAAGATGHQHHLDGYGPEIHIDDDGFGDANFGANMGAGRQLRGPGSEQTGQSTGLTRTATKKRKRNEEPLDPALTAGSSGAGLAGTPQQHQHPHQHQQQQQQQHQQQHSHHYGGEGLEIRAAPIQTLADARSIGLHSAAALFRQPSSNKGSGGSKKCTRPPMSKLFSSLELSPENFLHLQAAAKGYMLDDKYPERRECVGQRGKGDTEMVKLRLWNCVRQFLEGEGHGERFFGENVVNEGMGPRTYVWPRDQQKIITLVIPLLRRMVTNERQRQYAVETRKGGGEERRRRKTEDSLPNFNSPSTSRFGGDDHLQIHTQHDLHDEYPPSQPPMSASSYTQMEHASHHPLEVGLTDLLLQGYPTDWNAVSKSYDFYNQNYDLDHLWQLSGLQLPDWRGLVAAVDSHYQVYHHGGVDCPTPCEDENVGRILDSHATADLRWRIGGSSRPTRNEFASSIIRDVSRIIRDSLSSPKDEVSSSTHGIPHSQPFPPLPPNPATTSSTSNIANTTNPTTTTNNNNSTNPISLRLNILQNGKRTLPRFDLPAGHCPDLETTRQLIARRFAGQLPGIPPAPSSDSSSALDPATWASSTPPWKFKVWLPDGLTTVHNDGEWTIALLSASSVDWMDGDLRVLVEVGDEA